MSKVHSPVEEVDLVGKLADLKESHYNNTLCISALLELLVEKEIITMDELSARMKDLDVTR